MFDLHRQKITSALVLPRNIRFFFLAIFLIISQLVVNAQTSKPHYQTDYDAKDVKFGYFLGLPFSNFNMQYNNYYLSSKNKIYSITSPVTKGLKMGGVMNVRLNDYFDFRVLPTVAIYDRILNFNSDSLSVPSLERQTAWFELPLMVKYKSERRGNVRMYVFGGFRVGVESNTIGGKTKKTDAKLKSTDFSLEYGVGLEVFKEYFKFAPELHFSHGITNLADPVQNTNTSLAGLSSLTTHTVTLYLLFE